MPLGWVKGLHPLLHCPQSIQNGVTLVKTILEKSISSRFANVPPNPSVFRDKGLAEMSKEACVVNAAVYSYFRSVRGDSVTQTLVGYKNLKTSLPSDVYVGRAFHGDFRYNTPRNIRQSLPQTTTGTQPTCLHGTHIVEAAVLRRSAELPPPCPSKDVPNDLPLRSLSNFASYSRFFASVTSFSRCTLSRSARVASFSLCTLSESARKAATSSSDKGIILYLAVPAPRRCPSYILLRFLGPRWPPYQLYHTRCPRPPMAMVQLQ